MGTTPDMPWHPAASLFPMLSDERLRALAEDIRAHGQRDAIGLLAGAILDGRNRHRACVLAGVEPRFEHLNTPEIGDPWDYAASKNFHRRDLTEGQRATAGAKLAKHHEATAAKERQRASGGDRKSAKAKAGSVPQNSAEPIPSARKGDGDARQRAAAAVNVSHFSIDAATRVQDDGVPELVAAVEQGEVSVSAAAEVARLPAEEQSAVVAAGPKSVTAAAKAQREKRKASKPRASKAPPADAWDLAASVGEVNSLLLDIEHHCPARDRAAVVAFLENWVCQLKEGSHVRAAG